MVRYSHMRAVDMGVDVNFRHALSEDTGFPDDYFDIVTSYLLHHEITEEGTLGTIREAQRVLRPGGVYFPVDAYTSPARKANEKTAYRRIRDWITYRWNHERWWYDYQRADFFGEMSRVGFALNNDGPGAEVSSMAPGDSELYAGYRNIVGINRA